MTDTHKVRPGESLTAIAHEHAMTREALMAFLMREGTLRRAGVLSQERADELWRTSGNCLYTGEEIPLPGEEDCTCGFPTHPHDPRYCAAYRHGQGACDPNDCPVPHGGRP